MGAYGAPTLKMTTCRGHDSLVSVLSQDLEHAAQHRHLAETDPDGTASNIFAEESED